MCNRETAFCFASFRRIASAAGDFHVFQPAAEILSTTTPIQASYLRVPFFLLGSPGVDISSGRKHPPTVNAYASAQDGPPVESLRSILERRCAAVRVAGDGTLGLSRCQNICPGLSCSVRRLGRVQGVDMAALPVATHRPARALGKPLADGPVSAYRERAYRNTHEGLVSGLSPARYPVLFHYFYFFSICV